MPPTPLLASISGALVTMHGELVDGLFGAKTFERALERVEPEIRERYKTLTAISWVPVDRVVRVFDSVGQLVGMPADEVYYRVARRSVEHRMRTVWRVLLRVTSDDFLVSRAQALYAKGYNVGRLVASIPRPGHGEVAMLDWPDAPQLILRGVCAGVESVLAVAGRRNVRGTVENSADGGVCYVTWDT